MFPPLTYLIVLACLVQAGWAAWFVMKDRAVMLRQLWGCAVVEGLLLVQAIVTAGLLLLGSYGHVEVWELWGYLVTALLVLPLAAAWGVRRTDALELGRHARGRSDRGVPRVAARADLVCVNRRLVSSGDESGAIMGRGRADGPRTIADCEDT